MSSIEQENRLVAVRENFLLKLKEAGARADVIKYTDVLVTKANLSPEEVEKLVFPKIIIPEANNPSLKAWTPDAAYFLHWNSIFFHPELLNHKYGVHMWGEELGHWLYFQINPDLKKKFLRVSTIIQRNLNQELPEEIKSQTPPLLRYNYWAGKEITEADVLVATRIQLPIVRVSETVGRFAGMVLAKELGSESPPPEAASETPQDQSVSPIDELLRFLHKSYPVADVLVTKKGLNYFSTVIRWDEKDWLSALQQLEDELFSS